MDEENELSEYVITTKGLRRILNDDKSVTNAAHEKSDSEKLDLEKKIFFMQEKCVCKFDACRFTECLPLLRELLTFQTNFWCRLRTQLMICECLVKEDLKKEAVIEIAKSIDLVEFSSPRVDVDDIIELAGTRLQSQSHIQVVILYNCACKLHQLDSSPNEAVIGIMECFRKIRESAIAMFDCDFLSLAMDLCPYLMDQRLEDLRQIDGVETHVRTENEVICMNNIGMVLSAFRQELEAEHYYKEGLKMMLDKFGQRAYKFFICTALLNNMGSVKMNLGELEAAEHYFVQSLEAIRLTENFPTVQQKLEWKGRTERSLHETRRLMNSFAQKTGIGGG